MLQSISRAASIRNMLYNLRTVEGFASHLNVTRTVVMHMCCITYAVVSDEATNGSNKFVLSTVACRSCQLYNTWRTVHLKSLHTHIHSFDSRWPRQLNQNLFHLIWFLVNFSYGEEAIAVRSHGKPETIFFRFEVPRCQYQSFYEFVTFWIICPFLLAMHMVTQCQNNAAAKPIPSEM